MKDALRRAIAAKHAAPAPTAAAVAKPAPAPAATTTPKSRDWAKRDFPVTVAPAPTPPAAPQTTKHVWGTTRVVPARTKPAKKG
jgi:hypothetical protein